MDNGISVKKERLFRFLNVGLATLLTITGTVMIFVLIKFLNSFFSIGYILSFGLSIVLPQLYSLMVNSFILNKIDSKMSVKLLDCEDELDEGLSDNISLGKVEGRFNNLNRENKLRLLNMVRKDLGSMSLMEQVNVLNQVSLLDMGGETKIDSKKRIRVKDNLNK